MAIKPLGDRVLVKALEADEVTSGGIVLPDTAQEKPQQGNVIATGEGKMLEDGTIKPLDVKVGDRILYGKYSGTEVREQEDEFLIMREDDILAIVA